MREIQRGRGRKGREQKLSPSGASWKDEDVEQYINTGAAIAMSQQDESPFHGLDTEMHDPQEEKEKDERPIECKKSLFMDSQETPKEMSYQQQCGEALHGFFKSTQPLVIPAKIDRKSVV